MAALPVAASNRRCSCGRRLLLCGVGICLTLEVLNMRGILTAVPLTKIFEADSFIPAAPPRQAAEVTELEEGALAGWAVEERELEESEAQGELFDSVAAGFSPVGAQVATPAKLPPVSTAPPAKRDQTPGDKSRSEDHPPELWPKQAEGETWDYQGGFPQQQTAEALPQHSSLATSPSIAFLVLGLKPGDRPPWASAEDDIMPFQPPKDCPPCPAWAPKFGTSNEYKKAPKGWWCAQRYYMHALDNLAKSHSDKQYYFLADADTVVFPEALHAMVRLLEHEVLGPSDDLYMGHGRDLSIGRFVMSGGGVLLRGRTLRRAAFSGTLQSCAREHINGSWCWRHLDWVLADCMRKLDVAAQGHEAFQQMVHKCACCQPPAVACHPVKELGQQRSLGAEHRFFEVSRLTAAWAAPCQDRSYLWGQSRQSLCKRPARRSRGGA